jgi:uncharacterized membrane protein
MPGTRLVLGPAKPDPSAGHDGRNELARTRIRFAPCRLRTHKHKGDKPAARFFVANRDGASDICARATTRQEPRMADQPFPPDNPGHPPPEGAASHSATDNGALAVRARRPRPTRFRCIICGKEKPARDIVRLDVVRPILLDRIRTVYPDLPAEGFICIDDLDEFRGRYVTELLRSERGELTRLEQEVVQSLADHETLAENIQAEFEGHRTFGEKLSDHLANFGGSWSFILIFLGILLLWMAFNVIVIREQFDPYPFILLNLVLSCLAALQAPIIMMSQKRQEAKDRLRSENDYRVNLKAELEIRHLHEKIDHILTRQWERLAEIQQIQLEMMTDATLRKR